MNKIELEIKLREEGLLVFQGEDGHKQYVDGNEVFYNGTFHNETNIFGVYKESDSRYAAFVTDAERGFPTFRSFKKTEEEACNYLYRYVKTYL